MTTDGRVADALRTTATSDGVAGLIDAPSRASSFDRLADTLDTASHGLDKAPAHEALTGEWMGSPMHPGVVWIPSGLSLASVLLSGSDRTEGAARTMLGAALLTMPAAALTGIADAQHLRRRGRRIAVLHVALNTLGGTLQAAAYLKGKAHGGVHRPLLLSGFAVSGLAAMWGRHMAYNYRLHE